MADSLILTKSKAFAIRVVKLHKYLRGKREATMSKQILRCGTSIGANLAEAKYAQSKDDFISKQAIALKEAGETLYWPVGIKDSAQHYDRIARAEAEIDAGKGMDARESLRRTRARLHG